MIRKISKNCGKASLIQRDVFAGLVPKLSKPIALSSLTLTCVVSYSGVSSAQQVNYILDNGSVEWTTDQVITGDMIIGLNNKGVSATITNGAKVSVGSDAMIGSSDTSEGTVTVSGAGSELTVVRTNAVLGNTLTIGGNCLSVNCPFGGAGTMNVMNGAKVDAREITLASGVNSRGYLTVSGLGSVLSADSFSANSSLDANATLASRPSSFLTVENGATVSTNSAGFNISDTDSVANMNIRGAGTSWINSGSAYANGALTVSDGATVQTKYLDIGGSGEVLSSGANTTMTVTDKIDLGGRLVVADGSKLNVANTIEMTKDAFLIFGGRVDNTKLGADPVAIDTRAAGRINPEAIIDFGKTETARIVFNHNDSGYLFSNKLTGNGSFASLAGNTTVSGDLTEFSARDNVSGGVIVDGGSRLTIKGDLGTKVAADDATLPSSNQFWVKNGTLVIGGETGNLVTNYMGTEFYTSSVQVWGDYIRDSRGLSKGVYGTLAGNGTVGSTFIDTGATLSPGDSSNPIGSMVVRGQLAFNDGASYAIDVAGNSQSDRVSVETLKAANGNIVDGVWQTSDSGGKTLIGQNVSVQVTALDAATSYQNGQTYTILSSAGGIQGQFAQAISKSAFLDVALAQTSNEVDLTVAVKDTGTPNPGTPNPGNPDPGTPNPGTPNPGTPSTGLFDSVATTGNQRTVARALNTLQQSGQSLALYNSLLPLSAEEAKHAFEALSGEVHASAMNTLVTSSTLLRNSVNDRMRASFNTVGARPTPVMAYADGDDTLDAAYKDMPLYTAWSQGFGTWNSIDGNGNAADLSSSTGGFVAGLDVPVSADWRLGAVGGYSRSSFDANDRSSFGHSDNYHLGMYAGAQYGELSFRSGLTYTWHQVSTNRSVAFPGFNDHLKADYDAGTFQAFGELGYRIDVSSVAFEPFANLTHVNLQREGFNERGGISALSSPSDSLDTTLTTLGLRASSDFMLGGYIAKTRGMLGWQHAFGDTDPTSRLAFVGSQSYVVSGTPLTKDAAVVELGLDVGLSDTATIGVGYSGEFGSNETSNSINAKLDVRF